MKTLDHVRALEHVLVTMRQMIVAGNWIAAKRINEQLVTVFIDCVLSEDRGALARMRDRFAAFRSEVSMNDKETSPRSIVEAFMDANVMFASIAARRRPEGRTIAVNAEDVGTRSMVLKLLQHKGFMATSELADAVGVRPETMSRLLTVLKLEGLVTSRKAGRKVLSRLTVHGQKMVGGGFAPRRAIRFDIEMKLVAQELAIFSSVSQIKNPWNMPICESDPMLVDNNAMEAKATDLQHKIADRDMRQKLTNYQVLSAENVVQEAYSR